MIPILRFKSCRKWGELTLDSKSTGRISGSSSVTLGGKEPIEEVGVAGVRELIVAKPMEGLGARALAGVRDVAIAGPLTDLSIEKILRWVGGSSEKDDVSTNAGRLRGIGRAGRSSSEVLSSTGRFLCVERTWPLK